MAEYSRDGVDLYYEVHGSGPPVLFVHGMTGSGEIDWSLLVARLAPRYRCVVPDLRGHARSGWSPVEYGYRAICDDLYALIEREHLARPHLVGFSMGAECVLDLEVTRPGIAASLTMIGPCTGRPAEHPPIPSASARMPDQWPHVLRLVHAEQHGPDHWRTIGERITEDWQQRPEMPPEILATIECPMLVIVGRHELEFKRRQARLIEASSAHARVEEVPGDHPVHLQHPDVVNALVEEFLDELDEGDARPIFAT